MKENLEKRKKITHNSPQLEEHFYFCTLLSSFVDMHNTFSQVHYNMEFCILSFSLCHKVNISVLPHTPVNYHFKWLHSTVCWVNITIFIQSVLLC